MTVARDELTGSGGDGDNLPTVVTDRPVRPGGDGQHRLYRLVFLVWLVALLVLLSNESGRVFFDTKLGVDLDPASFLARLWQLYNPLEWFGTLQDQYIGYAFPMAPFYLLVEFAKTPVWVTERLWLSVLIATGFAGLIKLGRALEIGTDRSRLVAGLTFALWPTFTIVIGSTSAGIIPGLLAPWAVLPLVTAARKGGSPVRAAARSGVVVLCMGGVNATSTLDALILPALFILTQVRGRRLVTLGLCWVGAVLLATAWWVGPLLLQAKYSFNFLPYIEQSATTTSTMSAATFLRGGGNWTAYFNLGQPWLNTGWMSVTNPFVIMAAAIAAGTGLLGLARRDLPSGNWLRLSLGVAALVALAGYPGPLGGSLSGQVDQLLDGALAPLRSVYKIEPAAAAVLALGIAHALVLRARRETLIKDPAHRTLWHLAAAPAIALVLIGLAYPYLSGQALNPGPFKSVPAYWYQAARFLAKHSARAPALAVPAAAHGTYLWGQTQDDPLEPLATSPWVEQGLVPYGGAGSQLLLSSLEAAVASGERVSGLAATLARSGIRYLVVRNDLNPAALGYVSPQQVHQTLASSGFRRVAAFGPLITGTQTDPGVGQLAYALPSYPAIEVFEAQSAIGTAPPPAATALPVSATALINGGPDALLQLAGQHLLGWQTPAVIAGDKLVAKPASWLVTDSLPRADHTFGLTDATPSFTYTATETNPVGDPLGAAGAQPRQLLPVAAAGHQTVAVIVGAANVTASSSGSWLTESPQVDPVNAVDGNPSTYWAEASPSSPVGQWIQITFSHPISLTGYIDIKLLVAGSQRPVADRLTVRTAAGTVTSPVQRTGTAQPLAVPTGSTRTIRITIAGARGQVPGGLGAGFTEITIPGLRVTRYSLPAQDPAGRQAGLLAFSFHRQLPSPATLADISAYPPLARIVVTRSLASFRLAASAIAVPGRRLDELLAKLTPNRKHELEVTASSTFGSLPDLGPVNLFKVTDPGSWIAGSGRPVLRLSWQGKRTIRRMVIAPVSEFGAAPESIKVTSPDGTRFASIGLDGLTELVPPLRTDRMSISFPVVQYTAGAPTGTGQGSQLPVGLSKLDIPALHGLRPATLPSTRKFTLPCGAGPAIAINRRTYQSRVGGTVGDLISFRPLKVTLCAPGSAVTLQPGTHRLRALGQAPFSITDLSLVSKTAQTVVGRTTSDAVGRPVQVVKWQYSYRQVKIGSGRAAYLELHQNANPGWVATLDGKSLTPVTLDGWQQGYVVPAGAGGMITLTFAPTTAYHAWIIFSAVGALLLVAIAVARRRRRTVHDQMDPAQERSAPAPSAQVTQAAGSAGSAPPLPGWVSWLGLVALCGLIAVIGGWVALAVPVVAWLAWRWPSWYGGIALAAMFAAGLLTVVPAHGSPTGSGAFGAPAQALALIALTVALIPAWSARSGRP